jgi:hypothetical protein
MPGTRIAKTLDRLRDGALPFSSFAVRAFMAGSTGKECSGCGETIGRLERAYYVRMGGGERLRFHLVCHDTWVCFKRPA